MPLSTETRSPESLSAQIMPQATPHDARVVVMLSGMTLIDFLHYGLVSLVAIAAIATVWFAFYVVYRLHSD